MNLITCGFDLRKNERSQETSTIPDSFRLTPESINRICADPLVWERTPEVDSLIQDPTQLFWNPLGLAKDIETLLVACRQSKLPVVDLSPGCLVLSKECLVSLANRFGLGYFENALNAESLLEKGWRFLGFDAVALNGLHSALKGIGYKEPIWSELQEQFGSALNEVGLFSDETVAARFAAARSAEIPSHAPFDVVGILVHDPIK